jgi:hypothetical protein
LASKLRGWVLGGTSALGINLGKNVNHVRQIPAGPNILPSAFFAHHGPAIELGALHKIWPADLHGLAGRNENAWSGKSIFDHSIVWLIEGKLPWGVLPGLHRETTLSKLWVKHPMAAMN